jgi:hypothetical protein
MLCPQCHSGRCRRSKRHGIKDYTLGAIRLRPWRCRSCNIRFFASKVPMPFLFNVHCRKCGNLDIQRISREHVTTWYAWLFRLLRVPAYRCAPCRERFFSFLTFRRIRPYESKPAESEPDSPVHSQAASR